MTENRKNLIQEYKERPKTGGIFKVTNTKNGKVFLNYAPDIRAKQNAFEFSISSGSIFEYKFGKDWKECGGKAFTFEVLEEMDMKKDQSREQYVDDLKTLLAMWLEKYADSDRY